MQELTAFVEPYSIDEAFVQLSKNDNRNLVTQGWVIREKIYQWTGIPVSVGIAPSKTLAKLANEKAKANRKGVLSFAHHPELNTVLEQTPVKNIWGIGRGFTQRLFKEGIYNALQLKNKYQQLQWVRRNRIKVTGLRTVMELNGEPCLGLSEMTDPQKVLRPPDRLVKLLPTWKILKKQLQVSQALPPKRSVHKIWLPLYYQSRCAPANTPGTLLQNIGVESRLTFLPQPLIHRN